MALENPDALMDILYMLLSDSWVMKYYKSTKEDVIKIMNGEQLYLSETDLSILQHVSWCVEYEI